jgi:type VI protein secretion system component Hcp
MNKNTIILSLTTLLLYLSVSANATDVFITIDKEGNRIFSDIPSKESRTHKIKEISTVPAVTVQRTTATAIDDKDLNAQYQQLTIISPINESTLTRDKLGNFVVSAQLSSVLSENDEAVLLFDGQEISAGSQLNWRINNADRGAHSLQVIIRKQSNQQEKISSSKVMVYVKR